MLDFFRQNGLILSEFFCIWKGARIMKKVYHNRAKKFTFLRRFDRKNTVFRIIEKSNRKTCFQMNLNARKSCADSFLKIKPMIIELDFGEINKTVKNSTAKPRNSSL